MVYANYLNDLGPARARRGRRCFAASKGLVRYYVVEHDPRFGDPTFDPFEAAQTGFDYLTCVTF